MRVKVLNPLLFKSKADNLTIAENYTIKRIEVAQPYTSENEKEISEIVSTQAKVSLSFSLVIPFIFMMFMSASMDRAWSLYNMLQLIANFLRFKRVVFPPSSNKLLILIENMSNFNLGSNLHVQAWLRENVYIIPHNFKKAFMQIE